MSTERSMPKYRSHKEVWALKIAGIEFNRDESAIVAPADTGYATFKTRPEYRIKFKGGESDLGYYVRYQDGYESWSPTKAFEEGYSLVAD